MTNLEYLQVKMTIQQDIDQEKNEVLRISFFFGIIAAVTFCIHMFAFPKTDESFIRSLICMVMIIAIISCTVTGYLCAFKTSDHLKRRLKKLEELSGQNIDKEEAIKQIYAIKGIELVFKDNELVGIRES